MYQVKEEPFNRLMRALDRIGEHGLVMRGTAEEKEFVLALNEVKESMGRTLKYKTGDIDDHGDITVKK